MIKECFIFARVCGSSSHCHWCDTSQFLPLCLLSPVPHFALPPETPINRCVNVTDIDAPSPGRLWRLTRQWDGGERHAREAGEELQSELPTAAQTERGQWTETVEIGRGEQSSCGSELKSMPMGYNSLWSLGGIHWLPPCNYRALFPLLIHLNVCLCLFVLLISALSYCTKALITGSSFLCFSSVLATGVFFFFVCLFCFGQYD